MKVSVIALCLCTMFLASISWFSPAQASLSMYTDRTMFEGLGTIVENYGFEGELEGGTYHPWGVWTVPNPWTTHGVTYTSAFSLVITPDFIDEFPLTNVLINAEAPPQSYDYAVTGNVNASYDMFGVDLGAMWSTGVVDITIHTTLDSYDFVAPPPPHVSLVGDFYGWTADPGETINGFEFHNLDPDIDFNPAIDNVTLGHFGASPIPEPSTIALLIPGVAAFAVWQRRRRR